ncbi:regulator of chromosome condensation 1/beta-lactamase-inhibitor protein II, partial [Baffinella frigidus]
ISWPVLEHCEDTDFDYKDVSDALKITATVGIKSANASNTSSSVVLKQTISAIDEVATDAANRNINEIALNTAPPSRRLLSSSGEYGDWSSSEYKDWIDFKIPDIANYTEFAISDSTNRRLLQTEGGVQTCVNPVCGFSKGVDTTSECTQDGTYECEACKDIKSVIDPFTYNSTRLHCAHGICMLQFPGGKFKSWGMNWRRQQMGMYKASDFWKYASQARTSWIGDGATEHHFRVQDEFAKMTFADFGKDTNEIQLIPRFWSAMGPEYSVAIFTDNTARTWGNERRNNAGTLIDYDPNGVKVNYFGERTNTLVFALETSESIVEMTAGFTSFLVRTDKNNVFHSVDVNIPINLGTTKRVIQIASVVNAYYIVFSDGSVKSIGTLHGYAELQTSDNGFVGYTFATVKDAPFIDFGQGVKSIKSYSNLGFGVPANGFRPTIMTMNSNVNPGPVHTCAIMADDSIKCWGSNWAGQLGYEDLNNRGYKYPISASFPTAEETVKDIPAVNVGTGRKVIDMCLGMANTCVVLDNYKVKCWGTNEAGNLGQGDRTRRGHTAGTMGDNLPFIDFGTNVSIVQVECYDSSVCAVTMDGAIRCWGRNCGTDRGTKGDGSILPYSSDGYKQGETFSTCQDFVSPGPPLRLDCADKRQKATYGSQYLYHSLCFGVGEANIAPRDAPPKCGSSVTKSVTARIQMPISVEQFTPILQNQLISAVATVAN